MTQWRRKSKKPSAAFADRACAQSNELSETRTPLRVAAFSLLEIETGEARQVPVPISGIHGMNTPTALRAE